MDGEAGKRITQLRAERKWTQQYLAEQAGVNVSTLRRWESGDVIPQTENYKRVLAVLGVTRRERQETLATLNRPSSVQEQTNTGWTPRTGDLLRVLRQRRGLSQAQAAAQLRVAKSAISRWEKGSVPDADRLPDICAVYAARPEERDALISSKALLAPPPLPDDSLEQCEHLLDALIDAANSCTPFAGEPCFLLLEARLAAHARRNEQAQRLLAKCWTHHAEYLSWRHRIGETFHYTTRALDVVKGRFHPEPFWLCAVGLRAQYVRDCGKGGAEAAYAQLKSVLEIAGEVGCDLCILREMGGMAAHMQQWEHARSLLAQSRWIAMRRELDWGVRLANIEEAATYLQQGSPKGALPFLARDDNFDSNGHLTEIRMWVQTLRALGDTSETAAWIKRGDTLFTRSDLEFRRAEWENLKQANL